MKLETDRPSLAEARWSRETSDPTRPHPVLDRGAEARKMPPVVFRKARPEDLPALRGLHRMSFLTLGRTAYDQDAIKGFLDDIVTADPQLIADGTYHVAEIDGTLAASGGWTMRRPDYEARLGSSAPEGAVATIRAIFTAPAFAGRGLARRIMDLAETEAVAIGGAERLELCATRSAVSFYAGLGYLAGESGDILLSNGKLFHYRRMSKDVAGVLGKPCAPCARETRADAA